MSSVLKDGLVHFENKPRTNPESLLTTEEGFNRFQARRKRLTPPPGLTQVHQAGVQRRKRRSPTIKTRENSASETFSELDLIPLKCQGGDLEKDLGDTRSTELYFIANRLNFNNYFRTAPECIVLV